MPWTPGHGHVLDLDLPTTEYRWVMEQHRKPAKPGRQRRDIITELARALANTGAGKSIAHPLEDFGQFRPGARGLFGEGE
jgi:hypothetical protein